MRTVARHAVAKAQLILVQILQFGEDGSDLDLSL